MANVSQRQIVNKLAEPNLSAILKNIQLDDWFCLAGGWGMCVVAKSSKAVIN